MGTFVVAAILVGIVALIIRKMRMEKKAGRSPICGGDCSGCAGACHSTHKK